MGLFKNLKDGLVSGTSGLSEEHLAKLTPAQRAAYDAKMAQVVAVTADAVDVQVDLHNAQLAELAKRPLLGPAGAWLYGSDIAGISADEAGSMTTADLIARSNQASKNGAKLLFQNPLGNRTPPAAPMAPASDNVDRGEQIAIERSARDAARHPYLADQCPPVVFSRIATRGRTQIEEVTEYLAASGLAARPDLVYGLYRVPDRISPATGGSESGRVVEWDIVHAAPGPLSASSTPPVAVRFAGEDHWVERAVGEPSVLDEDLGVACLGAVGVGPEQTLGIARQLTIRRLGSGDADVGAELFGYVTGMHVFHSAGIGPIDRTRRPVVVPTGPPFGVHIEALNWAAIADAVHQRRQMAYDIPSSFPYLPSTAQELIRMYIEVVGLRPSDCYATSVTHDEVTVLDRKESLFGGLATARTSIGEALPCADGKDRRRAAGGSVIMFAYRDRPDYEVGRARWGAYQREVLQSQLENETHVRRPVSSTDFFEVPGLRQAFRAFEKLDRIVRIDGAENEARDMAPHRYCWPPVR